MKLRPSYASTHITHKLFFISKSSLLTTGQGWFEVNVVQLGSSLQASDFQDMNVLDMVPGSSAGTGASDYDWTFQKDA